MKATGMIIPIVLAASASATIGVVTAQTFEYDLLTPMLIATLFGVISGFLVGKVFNLISEIHGILTGLLGGMIGTLYGVNLYSSNKVILIADIIFIILMVFLRILIERQSGNSQKTKKKGKNPIKNASTKSVYSSAIILSVGVIGLAGLIFLEKDQIQMGQIGQPLSQIASYDGENDLQVAIINVTASGFLTQNTEFKAGVMIKAIFNVYPNAGTGLKLISNDLGINADLKEGQNRFIINNPHPGKYEFGLESGTTKGTFTVK